MWTKFGLKLQKNLRCRRPGGGGGSVISDTPGRGGDGGQKRANFCGRPLWMAPQEHAKKLCFGLHILLKFLKCGLNLKL